MAPSTKWILDSCGEKDEARDRAEDGDTAFRSTKTRGSPDGSREPESRAEIVEERTASAVDLASAGGTMERTAADSETMVDRGRISTPADWAREIVSALGGRCQLC